MSFASSAASPSSSSSSTNASCFGVTLKKCPLCKKAIDRCLVSETLEDRFLLFCTACEKEFTEPKSEESSMTTGGRKYSRKEEVKSLDQIGVCDLIQYEVSVMGIKKENFAICTKVDRASKTAHVVKLTLNDEEAKVTDSKVKEDVLLQKKATVYRFMPLDCCSRGETLSRAEQSLREAEDWLTAAVGESLSFEKFANWLKTGEAGDLILRVLGVINKCPTCKEPLYRSYCLNLDPIQISCTVCYKRCEIQNTSEQLSKVRKGFGKRCKTENLSSIDQLGPGDIFKRRITGVTPYTHHMICKGINRNTNIIEVIDLVQASNGKIKIQDYPLRFDDLKEASPKVDRYFPLDCFSAELTIELAESFATGRERWEPEEYSLVNNNCQHFATFCKTGKLSSEDVKSSSESSLMLAGSLAVLALAAMKG